MGEQFGQRRPPLSVTIKQILERYPDGQIFKEMIQNADDAGATVVQFFVDCRHHGTSGLVKPELAAYQGPALISANDAKFSEQDWDGIQSLQQSVKADDPFKVGRFGIGFNSVYHLTDLPSIVSGSKLAFLEPQERVWEGQSGRWFSLQKLSGSDHLNCLNGISNFDSRSVVQYNKTLFRFPLRSATSNLSDNVYSLQKVNELIDALRSEAKLLLLFLRSIHTIKVYNIDRYGNHTLTFETKISDAVVANVAQKRSTLLRDLKSCYASYKYNFSNVFKFTAKFGVSVYDANTRHTNSSHWLVANQVGSSSPSVRAAAIKQKVFPWVGTAVELNSPGNGRIFCFLPMPIETASNLPVHVNGTFGLNDDRRSLKWPGVERRNDPMADWNKMLVTEVIPYCYVDLLLEYKRLVSGKADFYKAWPNVNSLRRNTQWESLMNPVFRVILSQSVIWCKAPIEEWVTPATAAYVPRSGSLPGVVKNTLTACGVKLAQVPATVWDACSYARVPMTEVTPKFVRDKLRAYPRSYANCGAQDKRDLLMYCLSDGQFGDLKNLQLLPLSNNSFATFQSRSSSAVYMCSSEFPKWLLPNLDHRLVDVTNDPDLNATLRLVAQSNYTQMMLLGVAHVAGLLDEVMYWWRRHNVVSFPNQYIPSGWFEKFWKWVWNKQLQDFQNKLVLPIQRAHGIPATREFQVIRLAASQPVLYFPWHSTAGSNTMLSVLDKLGIHYCTQASFPHVQHSQLTRYIKEFSPSALLEVMGSSGKYASVSFTSQEAELLRTSFHQVSLSYQSQTVLQNLKIFSSCVNSSSSLYSISEVNQTSLLKEVVIQPPTTIDLSVLPSNVIILSSSDHYQKQLLHKLGHSITDGVGFLTQHILPKLTSMGDRYIDPIMTRVLDISQTLAYYNTAITSSIQNLEFIKVTSGARKRPCDLYDPNNASLCKIFAGQGVFPCAPYNSSKYIAILKLCGLRTSVEPQAILDLIHSLSLPAKSSPQAVDANKILRVRAIMKYVSSSSFQNKASGSYTLDRRIQRGYVPFSTALILLSTHRSWLPVLAERPSNYPASLPWKGSGYTSHLISLQGSVCALNSNSTTLPLLYGSQVYFTETFDSVTAEEPKGSLVAHFQEVRARMNSLAPDEMLHIVCQIYYAIVTMIQSRTDVQHLKSLQSMKEWVYIKKYHKFVSIDAVALKHNPGFRHNLEPYLHILPDNIARYSQLFKASGMNDTFSESQIVSILAVIKNEFAFATNQCSVSPEDTWSVVLTVLNWLTENGTKVVDNEGVYVPAQSDSQWPDLREPGDLVYVDNEFLKTVVSFDNDELLTYVHDSINQSLAKSLMITPLSKELDISEDTFEDAGQYEPLIGRLKNILRDYKDGLTIVKELIQNADDAEATEVNICFDNRHHTSERNRLFLPDMCESHGPALVIHNNSKFSDDDFANIQKLAGGTKQGKYLKIGKFGIGFCSVYHITDVPSFVSRDRLYIFDPTLRHLREAVGNSYQPGKRVNYLTKFMQRSKQMEPYEGLFGFKKVTEYNGTMFRLPFRTNASELSSTCYSQSTFTELLASIQECGDKLLLFLQNVQKITVQQFDAGMVAPKVLYELRRRAPQPTLALDNTSIVTLESKSAGRSSGSPQSWMVASYSTTHDKKPALANVACSLNSPRGHDGSYTVNSDLAGEVFCFLPLSQATGLPVHVSCNFAVINNRRGIWTSVQKDTSVPDPEVEVQWNMFLMKDVIPVAYSKLLNSLKTLFEDGSLLNYNFYSLWPLTSELLQRNPWQEFVNMLYSSLVQAKLFYSESTSQWLSMRESKFLDPDILGQQGSLPCVLDVIRHLRLPLVELPGSYKSHMKLTHERLTEKEFIELFFENISLLTPIGDRRNDVIMYMLKALANKKLVCLLEQMFGSHVCIPTAPDGCLLRMCTDIVSPKASFVGLFDESDHRFLLKTLCNEPLVTTALKQVGMMESTLTWNLIIDRAQSVEALMRRDRVKALERVKLILRTMFSSIDGKPPTSGMTIDAVEFLPVQPKPKDYPLKWHGDRYQLLSGRQLVWYNKYSRTHFGRIAGSQVAFLCEDLPEYGGCGYVPYDKTRELLKLRSSPSLQEVIAQLKEIITQFDSLSPPDTEWISISCQEIYQFIETALCSHKEACLDIDNELTKMACIWNGHEFLRVDCVAQDWKLDGPYLYKSPLSSHESLSSALGIKQNFTYQDAQKALEKMKSDSGNQPISESCDKLLTELITLFHSMKPDELSVLKGEVYLPDTRNVLHRSSDMVINDAPWAPLEMASVHIGSKFPRELAIDLGVRPVRSKIRENYISKKLQHFRGVPFGQHEKLTRRIQNIIRDYPFDITVLKELLQNADDAEATKMYVILDRRTHGKCSVLSEGWQELQGPALLVWNDSIFAEKDLQGIQELGLGSKRDEAERIGQYGIGFNVVYHLTDCPSFVTNGDTLCVLDPQCKYVPEADPINPGARYDVNDGFWNDFADMRSAYLQDDVSGQLKECLSGSLFRLPIRHTKEMVESSKIINVKKEHEVEKLPEPLTAEDLRRRLRDWMPSMKEAMLFLNHVTELKYIEIGEDGLHTRFHFKTEMKRSTHIASSVKALQDTVSAFNSPSNCRSYVILYPLTITDVKSEPEKDKHEKWLIQLGIGDINNEGQHWRYVKTVKPKHGIAAPLLPAKFDKDFGRYFCFLPLPACSDLPVHVNGSFVLDSSRRSLWKSTDPSNRDSRGEWNNNLLGAVGSSYADFLVKARVHYVKRTYSNLTATLDDIRNYYHLFPYVPVTDIEKKWTEMPCQVYKLLVQSNAEVLCVLVLKSPIKGAKAEISVEWHPLTSTKRADQVYFWMFGAQNPKLVHPLVQSIGMKVTSAPSRKMDCLNNVVKNLNAEKLVAGKNDGSEMVTRRDEVAGTQVEATQVEAYKTVPFISPQSVFKYYTELSAFSSSCGMQPCPIAETAFKDAKNFLLFTKYLLGIELEPPKADSAKPIAKSAHIGSSGSVGAVSTSQSHPVGSEGTEDNAMEKSFPAPPFSHFLLLSSDETLRKFDEDSKVLNSSYSNLFPHHRDMFLHPALRVANYNHSYFISTEDVNEGTLLRVLQIFERTLPSKMHNAKVVPNAFNIIKGERLDMLSYWECFRKDKVLASFLPHILKEWALVLTHDGRFFSTASEVLPCYCPIKPDDLTKHVCAAIMKSLQFPFLDRRVVTANVDLPKLSDHDRILSNFYHESDQMKGMKKEHIDALIEYFSSAAKPTDPKWVEHISSLPFFTDVVGKCLPISGKTAYAWPNQMCSSGYLHWIEGSNVIFVQADAKWTDLGSAQQLSINTAITAEQTYINFIFPRFDKLTKDERYSHLEHIKNCLYNSNKNYSCMKTAKKSTEVVEQISRARDFIDALKTLKCICPDHSSSLQPISSFCDHTVALFTVFPDFQTLPQHLGSESWLNFFRFLGLKTAPTKNEFLELCKMTASRNVLNARKCCDTLLEYIFSFSEVIVNSWSHDGIFLNQISEIPFVYTVNTSSVDWISDAIVPADHQVKLKGAALESLMKCLWTVRPLICLPHMCTTRLSWKEDFTCLLANGMGIIYEPNVADVVKNVRNICQGRYANDGLFDNYPRELFPSAAENVSPADLLSVMRENLKVLNEFVDSPEVASLTELPCIPVFCDLLNRDSWKVVLVKPCYVISDPFSTVLKEYHPLLLSLPTELNSYSQLLAKIGVKKGLELHHMQILLEKVHARTQEGSIGLDPNSQKYVSNAIQLIHFKLRDETHNEPSIVSSLSPLYLPDTKNVLKKSTGMIYCDTPSYIGHMDLDLKATHYTHFDIHRRGPYGVTASAFCKLLPAIIRPRGMSMVLKQVPDSCCESVKNTEFSSQMERCLKDEDNKLAIIEVYSTLVSEASASTLQNIISSFFSSLVIVTKHKLKMQIKIIKSDLEIGTKNSDYYLDTSGATRTLYIDDDLEEEEGITKEIARQLHTVISRSISNKISLDFERELTDFVVRFLKATTTSQREKLLARYNLELKSVYDANFQIELGKELPKCFHHRLDQDVNPDNIFHPMEYVGYEDKEGHFIVVQVAYLRSAGSNQFTAVYHINTHTEDEEGKDVSILELYKFLTGSIKRRSSEDLALVLYAESELTNVRRSLCKGDLADIKASISKELKQIWKLDKGLRNKAIRRLYLMWHPDKNLDDTERAEEVFQFLKSEIDRLERSEGSGEHVEASAPSSPGKSSFNYDMWDRMASSQREAFASEQEHAQNHPRSSCAGPFGQVNEQKRPEEGKRWVKQADTDYKVLCDIHSKANTSKGYGHVCFMAHQVVEKALKGGMYALCGLDGRKLTSHNLTPHAYALQGVKPELTQDLHHHTSPLESYYLDTRYPNRWEGYTDIPSDHYHQDDADEAKGHAKVVLDMMISILL